MFHCEDWTFEGVLNGSLIISRSAFTITRLTTVASDKVVLDPFLKAAVGTEDWGRSLVSLCSRSYVSDNQVSTDSLYVPLPTTPGTQIRLNPSGWSSGFLTFIFDAKLNELDRFPALNRKQDLGSGSHLSPLANCFGSPLCGETARASHL